MSIFVTSKADRPTTASDRSSKMTIHKGREKSVTPFVCEDKSVSPARGRVDQSPLQGALSIAIRKITGQNGEVSPRPQQFEQSFCQNQMFWTDTMQIPSRDNGLNFSQMQNLKNILQEFMQSLYCEVERQIYSKFNAEMKRMVIKYRQTEGMLKSLQQKLTYNADILQLQRQSKVKEEQHRTTIMELEKQIERVTGQMVSYRKERETVQREIELLSQENQRLSYNVERYQNILLRQIQQAQYATQISLHPQQKHNQSSRQTTSFTNLLAGKHKLNNYYPISHHDSLDYSEIMMTNSQTLNVNRLQPSLSPVSIRGERKIKANILGKKQPISLSELGKEKKRRK